MSKTEDLTILLAKASNGDQEAGNKLFEIVYFDLHCTASHMLKREWKSTQSAQSLIHEAFDRVFRARPIHWKSRKQFFGVYYQAMSHVLIDNARKRGAIKRGENQICVSLNEVAANVGLNEDVENKLHQSGLFQKLDRVDLLAANIVRMHVVQGMSLEEIASHLKVSRSTVRRNWQFGSAWLRSQL